MFFGSIFRRRRDRVECGFDTVFAMFQTAEEEKKEMKKQWKNTSICDPCAGSVWESFGRHFDGHSGGILGPKSEK